MTFNGQEKHCLKMTILNSRKDAKMKKFKDACKRLTDKGHSNTRIPGNLVKQTNKKISLTKKTKYN